MAGHSNSVTEGFSRRPQAASKNLVYKTLEKQRLSPKAPGICCAIKTFFILPAQLYLHCIKIPTSPFKFRQIKGTH